MSCITHLLEMKGDREFLPVNTHHVIEGGGVYEGYEYIITFTRFGARCGYVALKEPLNDVDTIECPGGITFHSAHHDAKDLLTVPCNDEWIGFDCNHGWDKSCAQTARKYALDVIEFPMMADFIDPLGGGTHKDYSFVEDACKAIIDQLKEAA